MSTAEAIHNEPHLEDILIADDAPKEKDKTFKVDSIEKAIWAARKYIEAQGRVDKRLNQNVSFKEKIDKWSTKACKEDIETLSFMKSVLKPFLESSLVGQKKGTRSIKLPEAVVGFRKSPSTVEIGDEKMAVSFCESNHPECLEIKKILKKSELKKLLETGELIPGVSLKPGAESMYIKEA